MPCLELPQLPAVDLSLILPDLGLDIPIPSLGISLCCKFQTPPVPLPIVSLGSLPIPNLAALLVPALALVNQFIDQINELLDQVQVDCPLQ